MTIQAHVLVAPVVTEKSSQTTGKYAFRVHPEATKAEIKSAVNQFYGVEVTSVNIIPIKAKTRMVGRGRIVNKRSTGKKAIVTLKSGQTLNFNDFK